jgi:hypothetical protein
VQRCQPGCTNLSARSPLARKGRHGRTDHYRDITHSATALYTSRSHRPVSDLAAAMGSAHSSVSTAGGEDEEDDEDPSAAAVSSAGAQAPPPALSPSPVRVPPASASKVLEQEPEVLPCLAADSPLSPQPSAAGTPRLLAGPGIKVWDPCHVLLPPPPPSPHAGRQVDAAAIEVVVVSHGECAAAMRPDLVGGRWPATALTARGERQARALAVFLRSRGARLAAAYASPLDRARATAALVCRVSDSSQLLSSCCITLLPLHFCIECT